MPTYTLNSVSGSGYVYSGGAVANSTLYLGQDTSYSYQSMMSFDTSALEGNIVSVTLIMRGSVDASNVDFTVEARVHDWGTSISSADWVTGSLLDAKTLLATAPTLGFSTSVDTTFTSTAAFATSINRAGFTRFMLCSSRQRPGITPTGSEYVGFQGVTASTSLRPRLVIVTSTAPPQPISLSSFDGGGDIPEPALELGDPVPHPLSLPYTGVVGVPQVMHIFDALHGRGTMAIIANQSGVVRAYTNNTLSVLPGQLYSVAAWFRAEGVSAQVLVGIEWRNALDEVLSIAEGLVITDTPMGWIESALLSVAAPSNAASARVMLEARDVVPGETHFVEEVWFGRGVFAGWSAPVPDVVMSIHETSIVGGEVGTPTIGYQMRTLIFPPSVGTEQSVPAPHLFGLVAAGTGVPSAEAFGTPSAFARTDWWSAAYPYRRAVTLSLMGDRTAPVRHPVTATLPMTILEQGKLRADFVDIEVLHYVDGRWERLPREVTPVGDQLEVRFLTDRELDPFLTDTFYMYYGAPAATGAGRDAFEDNPWPMSLGEDDLGVAYTRPGENWRSGTSMVRGARATVALAATAVRILADREPTAGIAEVQLDNGPWVGVDLFSPVAELGVEVWQASELAAAAEHRVRYRASGRTNPGAAGFSINVVAFEFVAPLTVVVGPEEVLVELWGQRGVGGS
jgi:hypothetical protein